MVATTVASAGISLAGLFSLAGDIALVTGAGRGLGFEIARAMAAAGATVILSGRDADRLGQAADTIANEGGKAIALPFDMTDAEQTRAAFAAIARDHGGLDIVVSNAGMRNRKPLEQFSDAELSEMVEVNLVATYRLAREAARLMRERQKGRLIIVTSIAGHVARPNDAVYAGCKHGLTGMMRALAAEYGPHGITSNAIAPGVFATEANEALLAAPETAAALSGRSFLGRLGRPAEIAGAAVFLASPAASFITGHVLTIDGGLTAKM